MLCIFAAKNRTTSPSAAHLQQPTNIGSKKNSVSSSNLKRETSPTVCCYYINNRSLSIRGSDQKLCERDRNSVTAINVKHKFSRVCASGTIATVQRSTIANLKFIVPKLPASENFCEKNFRYLKDKIGKFENTPSNNHENIKNRTTTRLASITTKTSSNNETAVQSVGENCGSYDDDDRDGRKICGDKNSSKFYTLIINRTGIATATVNGHTDDDRKCTEEKFVNDTNSNKINCSTSESGRSSLTTKQLLHDVSSNVINSHLNDIGDDINITNVFTRHLAPAVNKKSRISVATVVTTTPRMDVSERAQETIKSVSKKQNSLNDNDFSFIDSSSRSVSRSSSTSFASDDGDERVNQRKFHTQRIPKINRINNFNYNQELSVKKFANQNIYPHDQSNDGDDENGSWDERNLKLRNAKLINSFESSTAYKIGIDGQHLKSTPNNSLNQSTNEKAVS